MPEQPSRQDENSGCVWIAGAVTILLAYGSFCALAQGGPRRLGSFWLSYLVLALVIVSVVAIAGEIRSGPIRGLTLLCLGGVIVWLRYAGTFANRSNVLTDFSALAVAGVLATFLVRWLGRRAERRAPAESAKKASKPDFELVWFVLAVTLTWVLGSVFTLVRGASLPTDARRFAQLGPARSIVPAEARAWEGLRIGLALSGGGYRAALFHAGALEALEDLGIRVDALSTVSGGSIIGAYYAVGGDPKDFVAAVRDGRFALKRELLLPHNTLRLLAPLRLPGSGVELLPFGEFDRLDVQTRLLDRLLFRRAELQAGLRPGETAVGQPLLMMAATDLTYGFQIGFLPDGILKLGAGVDNRRVYRGKAFRTEAPLSLAERVADSGAFPMAFPPRPWRIRVLPDGKAGWVERELLLADGGLRDNLGLDLLRAATALASGAGDSAMPAEWRLDALLSSNGGAILGLLEAPGGPLTLLPRAFDVAGIEAEGKPALAERCPASLTKATTFAPAGAFFDPDTRFERKAGDSRRDWNVHFNPSLYPAPVLQRIVGLLPEAARGEVGTALIADLEAFRAASTLDDRPSEATLLALERLGKLLVYLSWPELKRDLDEAARCKALPAASDPASRRDAG